MWRMEDVLDLYEEPHDEKRPVVCFDELPYQLVAEKRTPLPAEPGRPARYDCEHERKGTANVFAFFEPKEGWRHPEVTERRTAVDFAHAMRRLADEHYPKAEKIRVVMDNLNTHTGAALFVRSVRACGSQAPLAPVGVPSHEARARLLARPGRDRAIGALAPVPFETAHPGRGDAQAGTGRMGAGAQREGSDGCVALHGGGRPGEVDTPLPGAILVAEY